MNISKLTILPFSKHLRPVILKNPDNDIVGQELLKVTKKIIGEKTIPVSLAKKQAKEKSIPEYINRACYAGRNYSKNNAIEDARVPGGSGLDYFG